MLFIHQQPVGLAIIPNNLIRLRLTQNLTPCHLSSCQKCAIPWSPWFRRSSESCETLSHLRVESLLCQIVAYRHWDKSLRQNPEIFYEFLNRQKERPWSMHDILALQSHISMCFMWFQHNPVAARRDLEMAPSTSQTGIPSSVVVSGGTAWQYSISSQDRNMFAAKTFPQFWFLEKQKGRPRRSFWHRPTNFSKNFPKVHAALLPGRVSFSTVQKFETWPNEASPCPNGTMEQQPTDSENWSRLQEHPCSQQLSHQLKFAYYKFIQIHNIKQIGKFSCRFGVRCTKCTTQHLGHLCSTPGTWIFSERWVFRSRLAWSKRWSGDPNPERNREWSKLQGEIQTWTWSFSVSVLSSVNKTTRHLLAEHVDPLHLLGPKLSDLCRTGCKKCWEADS